MGPGKKALKFQNQKNICLEKERGTYCYFYLYKCLVLSLEGTIPILPPYSFKLLRHVSDLTCYLLPFQTLAILIFPFLIFQ